MTRRNPETWSAVKTAFSGVGVRLRAALRGVLCSQGEWQRLKLALLALVFAASQLLPGTAHARGLSLGLKIQAEVYKPLVPVARGFRSCFQTDASGNTVLGICADGPARAPAGVKSQQGGTLPAAGGVKRPGATAPASAQPPRPAGGAKPAPRK
jgi:hypothetical protein